MEIFSSFIQRLKMVLGGFFLFVHFIVKIRYMAQIGLFANGSLNIPVPHPNNA